MGTIERPDLRIDTLTAACDGDVFSPETEGYLDACASWNLAWTHQPAIVVRARSEEDVVRAVRHAAACGLTVAIQNTGHGVTSPAHEGALLITLGGLDHVRIDPAAQTATFGGGVTWAPVLAAAQEHGLAPLLGSSPHVGAVGYTLGGGFGWLARRHGLAVDAVRSMRVVLADGRVVTTSETEEPELFWAMCGTGGGALGIVVEMTVNLAPVAEVYAGNLFYPLEAAREAFDFYRTWSANAPDDLTSAFNIMAFPPLEEVPEPLRGQTFTIIRGCHSGPDRDSATALVDQWRNWREPLIDMWGPMPFTQSAEISQDPVDPLPGATSGRWLASLDENVCEAMLDLVTGGEAPSPVLFAEIRHAGGAIGRDHAAVSFAGREAAYSFEMVGLIPDSAAAEELERRFRAAWQRINANLASLPGLLNFTEGPEKVEISRKAFEETHWPRLAAAKRRYDPEDLFQHGILLSAER